LTAGYNGTYKRQVDIWNGKAHYENERGMQLYYYDANDGGASGWSFDDRRQEGGGSREGGGSSEGGGPKGPKGSKSKEGGGLKEGGELKEGGGSQNWYNGGWIPAAGGAAYPPLSGSVEVRAMLPEVLLQHTVDMGALATAESTAIDLSMEVEEEEEVGLGGRLTGATSSPRLNASRRGFWQNKPSEVRWSAHSMQSMQSMQHTPIYHTLRNSHHHAHHLPF
jgi:hypothetical protein